MSTELPVPPTIEQDFKQEQSETTSYTVPNHDLFTQLNSQLNNQMNSQLNTQLINQHQLNHQPNDQQNDQSNNQSNPNILSGLSLARPVLRGVVKPTKDEWIQLFEEATNTSAKEVHRNNPMINYGTFCTRFTKYKNGDVEGATMVLGKRGRPLGGGGKKRLSMQSPSQSSVVGQQDTDASDDEEANFGSAPKRVREFRGDEDSDDQPLGELSQIISAHASQQQPVTPASFKRRPGRPSKKLTESSPSPNEASLLAHIEEFEKKRQRDIKRGIENMRNTAGNTARAADMLGELEKQELNDLSEEVEAARSAVQAVLDRRSAAAAAAAANSVQT